MLTIAVHKACNSSFQVDEDYFVNTLAPFAKDSYASKALLRDVFAKYAEGKKQGLVHKVLNEFDHAPSGIILPAGQVAKRFEGGRLHRVAWKIVRGLYFHEFGDFLPENTPNRLEIFPPDKPPSVTFLNALMDARSRGQYPGAHCVDHGSDVGGPSVVVGLDEVGVFLGHLGRTDTKPA